jgi:23S rRNA (cytidine2498-2'-O)-methyltransferase
LFTCQAGYEALLARELAEWHGVAAIEQGPGWVRSRALPSPEGGGAEAGRSHRSAPELAFAHLALLDPVEVRGDSVNALAARIAEFFLTSLRGERIEATWPSIWLGPQELVGLGRRIGAVEAAFGELLRKKLSRVARLASPEVPRSLRTAPGRGLFVYFVDFGRVWVARAAGTYGQRRMADDDLAPSRSYLKVEEAYGVLGGEPTAGETVCDLGAAPGGWSYSAAKRGARVVAIDNGPLKGGALGHPLIEHRPEDAFKFRPAAGETFDWLFCDLVEEPHHVLQHLVEPWLAQRWCRRCVVNLKFGRVDAIALLRELHGPGSPFGAYAPGFQVRHLYHDREEFTVVGGLAAR